MEEIVPIDIHQHLVKVNRSQTVKVSTIEVMLFSVVTVM